MTDHPYSTCLLGNPDARKNMANVEGLPKYKHIIANLDMLDQDIHDLGNITGIAVDYFDTFQTGRDKDGSIACRMTYDELNRFNYILRTAALRAKLLHEDYLKAMKGDAA